MRKRTLSLTPVLHRWEKMPTRETVFGTVGGNYILRISKDVYVSYQPWDENPQDNIFDGIFGIERKKIETALYDGLEWRILNGDYRKPYSKCKTLEDCLQVYDRYKGESRSDWSTEEDD